MDFLKKRMGKISSHLTSRMGCLFGSLALSLFPLSTAAVSSLLLPPPFFLPNKTSRQPQRRRKPPTNPTANSPRGPPPWRPSLRRGTNSAGRRRFRRRSFFFRLGIDDYPCSCLWVAPVVARFLSLRPSAAGVRSGFGLVCRRR